MISKFSDDFQDAFKIQIWDAASGRPDMKPVVENGFNDFNNTLVFNLPGAVLTEAGDPDSDPETKKYKDNAALDINEFEQLITLYCLHHNKRVLEGYPMSDDMVGRVNPRPIDLWEWGFDHALAGGRPAALNAVRMHCLPHDSARVTERGICFENKYYECKMSIAGNWQSIARNVGEWWVEIVYEPNNLRQIYLVPQGGDQRNPVVEPCWRKPSEGESHDISRSELRGIYIQLKVTVRNLKESQPQENAEFAARVGKIVDTAINSTKQTLGGRGQETHNLGEARDQARSEEREKRTAFDHDPEHADIPQRESGWQVDDLLPASSSDEFDEIQAALNR
jgi:hypothetical protein